MKTRESEVRFPRLREATARLRELVGDSGRLERELVDTLVDLVAGERGTLVKARRDEAAGRDLEIVVRSSRVAAASAGERRFVDQNNAEFALHHALVKKAVRTGHPVVASDAVVASDSEGIEVSHPVLCAPFSVSKCVAGAVYLAREVGAAPFSDDDREAVAVFFDVCLPVLQSAWLNDEIESLRESAAASPDESDTEDEPDGEESPWLEAAGDAAPSYYGIVGRSPRLVKIFELIERIKDTDFNVCIFGESGTGKELLARAIHLAGKRSEGQFISENCGAISETLLESELFGYVKGAFTGADDNRKGLFELADGGTLFLDEIGDMSEGMQRKLLRVLQEGVIRPIGSKKTVRVDVRVLCASNRDLRLLVENGTFRADLYYRLNVINVDVPPLRERMEDVPSLVRHILDQIAVEDGLRRRLSESAMKALLSYSWPGNVRELTNVLRRVMITGKRRLVTRKEILPLLSGGPARSYVGEGAEEIENQILLRIPRRQTFNEIISECEKAVLLNALKENRWNKSRVTKVLQIPRQSLYNKIAKYDLKR